MSERVVARPLSADAFAPYGDVIEKAGADAYPINAGMCMRYHDLARVETLGPGARTLVNIFSGKPYDLPLSLGMVERHPLGSQAFLPTSDRPFLVVVCPDDDGRPGRLEAFVTDGAQGVNYRPNVWHGVLTPLGEAADFVVVDRGGEGTNLEEFVFETPYEVVVE